jgi:hypothetical protein
MCFVFCRIYPSSPMPPRQCLAPTVPLKSLLLTNTVSQVRACLSIWLERFRGTQNGDEHGPRWWYAYSRQSVFSPIVGIGTSTPPHPQASVTPPPGIKGGRHLLEGEGVGESQYRRGDICFGTVYIYVLCCDMWQRGYTVLCKHHSPKASLEKPATP